jgi:hypothetical protein
MKPRKRSTNLSTGSARCHCIGSSVGPAQPLVGPVGDIVVIIDPVVDDAYVYGKRYCTFCLEALPVHNYYGTLKYRAYQNQHTRQMAHVLQAMKQRVMPLMDMYEAHKEEQRRRMVLERQRVAQEQRFAKNKTAIHRVVPQRRRFDDYHHGSIGL